MEPKIYADPTFTPLREDGKFKQVPPPPSQTKKDSTDPDWDHLNPDIVSLCQRNGMARSCLNTYLTGQLNWMECLETMVVALGKELLANQEVLVNQRNEYVSLWQQVASQVKQLDDACEHFKQLPDGDREIFNTP